MYCAKCGFQNPDGARFCGNCGTTLPQPQVQPQAYYQPAPTPPAIAYAPAQTPKMKVGPRWASIGASLVLICFFMPWLMVSCSASNVQASALQLAVGNYGGGGSDTSAYPGLFIFLLLGLLGLYCLNGKRSGAITALATGITGVIGLVVFMAQVNSEMNQMTIYGLQYEYMIGFFGEWLGFLTMIGIGVLALQGAQPQPASVSYPGQPANWSQPPAQPYGYPPSYQSPAYPASNAAVPPMNTPQINPANFVTPPAATAPEMKENGTGALDQ